jgi:hypothetical protein
MNIDNFYFFVVKKEMFPKIGVKAKFQAISICGQSLHYGISFSMLTDDILLTT